MTAIPHSPTEFLAFYAEGSATPLRESGPNGATLASGTTYYVEVGGDAALIQAFQLDWDSAIIMDVTLEDTLWARGSGTGQATTSQVAGRAWCQESPTETYVGITTSAGTITGTDVSIGGGRAGTAIWHHHNFGSPRVRFKIVVGATGGNVNARAWGKM